MMKQWTRTSMNRLCIRDAVIKWTSDPYMKKILRYTQYAGEIPC